MNGQCAPSLEFQVLIQRSSDRPKLCSTYIINDLGFLHKSVHIFLRYLFWKPLANGDESGVEIGVAVLVMTSAISSHNVKTIEQELSVLMTHEPSRRPPTAEERCWSSVKTVIMKCTDNQLERSVHFGMIAWLRGRYISVECSAAARAVCLSKRPLLASTRTSFV